MNINVRVEGVGPMLQHNERLANPFDPITRQLKAITSKRKKTDEDLAACAALEFEGGLYFDPDLGPYLPTYNLKRSFVEGARINKLGKHVERAFVPLVQDAPLQYTGPRTVEGLYAAPGDRFVDRRMAKVSTSKVLRVRPRFENWAVEFSAYIDGQVMTPEDLQRVATDAGLMVGVGDFRQRYGRYTVTITEA